MVIMSDGEAFGWKMTAFVCIVVLIILLFVKSPKNDCEQYQERIIDTVMVSDTIYQTDTVTVWKQSKPDTVYIMRNDTI